MFSIVLATVMTAGSATPTWGIKCHGCHGCRGCSGSCYGGCYGCGGGGCYGGCGGGYGACYGGCGGCSGGCYGGWCAGCSSCGGCYGGCGGGWSGWGCGCGGYRVASVSGASSHHAVAAVPAPSQPATVTVQVPTEARLFVNDYQSKQTSATRTIVTPPLSAGQEYVYTLRAEVVRDGRTVTESRQVSFRAGGTVAVDFSNLTSPAAATARR